MRSIPASTVRIIRRIGMNENIKPNAQAEALSHKAFFVKFEIVRYKICENLVIIFLQYVFSLLVIIKKNRHCERSETIHRNRLLRLCLAMTDRIRSLQV